MKNILTATLIVCLLYNSSSALIQPVDDTQTLIPAQSYYQSLDEQSAIPPAPKTKTKPAMTQDYSYLNQPIIQGEKPQASPQTYNEQMLISPAPKTTTNDMPLLISPAPKTETATNYDSPKFISPAPTPKTTTTTYTYPSVISPNPKTTTTYVYPSVISQTPSISTTKSTTTIMASNLTFPLPAENKTVNPIGLVGAPGQTGVTKMCLSRIIQQGLLRLPQISSMVPLPTFTNLQKQNTSYLTYYVTYSGAKYSAKIKGTCKSNRTVVLDQVSYTKIG